ncbi:NADP-dependent oxidoreductase domain-containing protein 1-like [Haliotis asinina]|uniref:NADP-dependent oxidoreductase domain-containing protein 1-like n=1 Tax=Haliotis asinina TaxID=109174 RepID=UPI00353186A4
MRGVHRYNMALLTRLSAKNDDTNSDITRNLHKLQFESALSEEERKLLVLRARSHAIAVSLCAQATYFVDILNEGRQLKNQLKSPQKRTTRILQDFHNQDPLLVGIIGCGHVGSQIAHCLLTYGRMNPSDLHISTRRPETLEYLASRGTECYNNNVKLVSSVHLVFVCVLPSQLSDVAEEVKEYLTSSSIIYCTASSVSPRKLKQLFGTDNIVKPQCDIKAENCEKPWDYSVNINTALGIKETVETTSPFAFSKTDCIVSTPVYVGGVMVYAFLNMCSSLGMGRQDSLDALHMVMFGETDKEPIDDRLRVEHFIKKSEEDGDKVFPRFDLVKISENTTVALKKIVESEELKHAFASRYWEAFEQYVHLKAYGQV